MSLTTIFTGLSTAAAVTETVRSLIKNTRGTKRTLLLEIQRNLTLLYLFKYDQKSVINLISKLETKVYDEAVKSNFDFSSIKRGKIKASTTGNIKQFRPYVGWSTEQLFENIYLKIHALKSIIEIDPKSERFRLTVRLKNLQKMMLLLLKHAKT